jgi:hypothetical protein
MAHGGDKKICWESKLSCREKALHSKSSLQSGFEERDRRDRRDREGKNKQMKKKEKKKKKKSPSGVWVLSRIGIK